MIKLAFTQKYITIVTKEIKPKVHYMPTNTKRVLQKKLLAKVISHIYKTKNSLITKLSIYYLPFTSNYKKKSNY